MVRRLRSAWWAGILGLLACRAPEANHPSRSCSVDLPCPDALICYRGFCVTSEESAKDPDEDAVPSPREDAGATLEADPFDAAGASADAIIGTGDDNTRAAEDMSAPSPAGTHSEVSPATEETRADAGTRVEAGTRDGSTLDDGSMLDDGATPAGSSDAGASIPASMLIDSAACLASCVAPLNDAKECRKCVKKTFGATPAELCGGDDDDESEPKNPICAVLCVSSDLLGVECGLSCSGDDCTSERADGPSDE